MTAQPITAESTTPAAAWQHLDRMVEELTSLAAAGPAPTDFWRMILARTVQSFAAPGGAVWLRGDDGRLTLVAQQPPAAGQMPWSLSADAPARHDRLLAHVIATGLALAVPPHESPAGVGDANPTAYLLLLSPVVVDSTTQAIVEIFQRPQDRPTAAEGYLRFLHAVSELAADYERNRQLRALRADASARGRFDAFTRAVHGSLDLRQVATTIANDGRALLDCDRASIALRRGRRTRLISVSGVDTINPRAASTRRLQQLIEAVVAVDEPLWYPLGNTELPPQLEQALQEYLDESPVRHLAVLPLHVPTPGTDETSQRTVLGALVLESFAPIDDADQARREASVVIAQSELALANALAYQQVPLAGLWGAGRRAKSLVRGDRLPKTLLAALLLVGALAALLFIQVDFTVSAQGELLPERRRQVFAPTDGIVDKISVAHGDTVAAGDPLVALRRPQLEFERTRVLGELQTARKRLAGMQAARFGGAAASADARDQAHQRTADEEEVKGLLKSLTEQLAVLDRQEEELLVRSPIAGQVLTWDVAQALEARPVQRGHALLTVGDPAGPWKLEMRVADDRIGHVLAARTENNAPLPVTFLLAMDPDQQFDATLDSIAMTTDVIDQAEPQVLTIADVSSANLPHLRPGARAVAKIHCGRRSLGYVWLHDVWDVIRTRVFF